MRLITLAIVAFSLTVLSGPPVDARGFRGGSSRFSYSSSRYSSSRYSYYNSRYGSTYRYSSTRSYRRYSRYSRTSYGYYSYGSYRTSVSAIGMGGVTVNKQTLLLAGSVYVAHSMRPNLYTTSGVIISHAVDDYAICSGQVRWNTAYNNGTYLYVDGDSNSTSTTDLYKLRNSSTNDHLLSTTAAAPLGSSNSSDATYRYFLCPNDLMDGLLDDDDAFCCGPPGSQMCCDEADFWQQDVRSAGSNFNISLTVVSLIVLTAVIGPLYFFRHRISAACSCLAAGSSSRSAPPPPQAASTSAVTFQAVNTSEPLGDGGSVKFHGDTGYPSQPPPPPLNYSIAPPVQVFNGQQQPQQQPPAQGDQQNPAPLSYSIQPPMPSHPPPPYPALHQ